MVTAKPKRRAATINSSAKMGDMGFAKRATRIVVVHSQRVAETLPGEVNQLFVRLGPVSTISKTSSEEIRHLDKNRSAHTTKTRFELARKGAVTVLVHIVVIANVKRPCLD
jgi:hypothetical protein